MEFSAATMGTAGILLLTLVAVEYGGIFLLSIHRGKKEFTDFQRSSFRAGHAHAGVLGDPVPGRSSLRRCDSS